MASDFDRWCYFNDDPVADPSALALMALSREVASSGIKVMLAGDGADEILGGYNAYLRFVAADHLRKTGPLHWVFGRLFAERDPRLSDYLSSDTLHYRGTSNITSADLRAAVLEAQPAVSSPPVEAVNSGLRPGAFRTALLIDQQVRLPNDVLPRTDRATMAYSVESRVPYLDRAVVEAAAKLPSRELITIVPPRTKALLKRVATRRVPPAGVYRRKIGFDLPVADWLRSDFRDRIEHWLTKRMIDGLSYAGLAQTYAKLGAGQFDLAPLVWAWLCLEQWHDAWTKGNAVPLQPVRSDSTSAPALFRNPWPPSAPAPRAAIH